MDNVIPLVSCITPTYGRFNFLKEMYWSFCQQVYENKELIIVNDEKNLILKCNDPRVKIFNIPERFIGLGAKRNFCISQISPDSKYVIPFDDDDLFLPEHISSLVAGLEKYPKFNRTKNNNHFRAMNNEFYDILPGSRPLFCASCIHADLLRNNKFKDEYVMGEDTVWLEENNITTFFIDRNTPTFIYRSGMGVIHASDELIDINSESEQKNLHEKIGNSVNRIRFTTERELIPEISEKVKELYDFAMECAI
jgi:glycosyltransferase involved in cell wall biosynthesis